MKPGIYPRMTREEYDGIDALNYSTGKLVLRSLAHARAAIESKARGEERETPALIQGKICHKAVFEWDDFQSRYIAAPDGFSASHVKKHADFIAASAGREICTGIQYAIAKGMAHAAWNHPEVGPLLRADGHLEMAMVWVDPETGLLCKGMADKYNPLTCTLLDLKTTVHCLKDPAKFLSEIYRLHYHLQAAVYTEALAIITGEPHDDALILAAEKSAPYLIRPFRISGRLMEIGRGEWRGIVRAYAHAKELNEWPGYDAGLVEATEPPAWASEQDPNEEMVGEPIQEEVF